MRSGYKSAIPAILLLASAVLVACAGPVIKTIGENELKGQIIDKESKQPIQGALVVVTLDKGGFWTRPSAYHLGHAISDINGKFIVPTNTQTVFNAHDPSSSPGILIVQKGYRWMMAWEGLTKLEDSVWTIQRMEPSFPPHFENPCDKRLEFSIPLNEETCKLIRAQLHLA